MTQIAVRHTARKRHTCGTCGGGIRHGEDYVAHTMTPSDARADGSHWQHVAECESCALASGRGGLLVVRRNSAVQLDLLSALDPAPREWPRDDCRSCPASVVWAVTSQGKRMLVDRDPVAGGNVELVWHGPEVRARIILKAQRDGRDDLRTSHFVTCPNADEWRRS